MCADQIKIVAETRTETGSGAARRLRRDGWIPAVVNDEDGASAPLKLNRHDFEVMLHHHTSESLLIDLAVGQDALRKVILKEVQHHPVSGLVEHVDFMVVSLTKKMKVPIPVELVGEAAGVDAGGILEQLLREVEVECLPTDLVEGIQVDVSALDIGDSLAVHDIVAPPGVEILTSPELAIAAVAAPRLAEEEEEAEEGEGEGEGEEPEVIGQEKKEAGEEEKSD